MLAAARQALAKLHAEAAEASSMAVQVNAIEMEIREISKSVESTRFRQCPRWIRSDSGLTHIAKGPNFLDTPPRLWQTICGWRFGFSACDCPAVEPAETERCSHCFPRRLHL